MSTGNRAWRIVGSIALLGTALIGGTWCGSKLRTLHVEVIDETERQPVSGARVVVVRGSGRTGFQQAFWTSESGIAELDSLRNDMEVMISVLMDSNVQYLSRDSVIVPPGVRSFQVEVRVTPEAGSGTSKGVDNRNRTVRP
ncbi:MAG: hypothetical protein KBD56_01505 [Candidatus Eisenbacteria bacterium]|nr:hypothetical protein [Candidatus Eisenbacteria bacterium]